MVRSSSWIGHRSFTAATTGSSPARITILGYRQAAKAQGFDPCIAGSSPAIPAKYDAVPEIGLRGQSAKLLFAGSNPARISNMAPPSNWSGRRPLKPEIVGSNPTGVTIIWGVNLGGPRDRLLSGLCRQTASDSSSALPAIWDCSPTGRASG